MRIRMPDHKNASSVVEESERQMKFTLSLRVSDDASFTIVRNVYECFRMLGDALLIVKGMETADHVEPIKALLKMNVNTARPISTIDNLRRLRHKINYYGYHPTIGETKDAVEIAKACFGPLLYAVKKKVKKTI